MKLGVSSSSLRARTHSIARKLFKIIRSSLVRGARPLRIISFATFRVVDAPSSWLDVIASSTSDLKR